MARYNNINDDQVVTPAVEPQAPARVEILAVDQIYVDCITQHYGGITAESIQEWDNEFVMRTLLEVANEFYHVGYMVNGDGRAYGSRYSKDLPDACRIALKWAESSTDQSNRLWSQWTTAEV